MKGNEEEMEERKDHKKEGKQKRERKRGQKRVLRNKGLKTKWQLAEIPEWHIKISQHLQISLYNKLDCCIFTNSNS